MNKQKLIECIERICPSETAEDWDNCGFQIDCMPEEVDKVLVSLEVTDAVIDEAVSQGARLILTHHPLLFGGIKKIEYSDVIGGYLIRLIQEGISVYSCHTNFDKAAGGNNDYLGQLLELSEIRPFDRDNGFCRKGQTPFDTTFMEVIHKAGEAFGIDTRHFRWVGDLTKPVETIGWCTGAGSEFIKEARAEGCDLYITGDLKYHEAQLAKEMGMCILDAGHYGSEKIFTENMAAMLLSQCAGEDLTVVQSDCDLNPFG